jgi:hypothetical protein
VGAAERKELGVGGEVEGEHVGEDAVEDVVVVELRRRKGRLGRR